MMKIMVGTAMDKQNSVASRLQNFGGNEKQKARGSKKNERKGRMAGQDPQEDGSGGKEDDGCPVFSFPSELFFIFYGGGRGGVFYFSRALFFIFRGVAQ